MLRSIMFWLNINRIYVFAFFGLCFWLAAYLGYFRPLIESWFRRGRAHSWSVDMVGKKAVSRGKTEVH